ncbi:MAG TPA: DNA polymerase III subunit delta [Myxococcota bacterium]|nr:DNA polymerase III subunit delta [Myxococcota bacterium]
MNHAELERELADRGPRRAYLLAGAETLLRDDALAALRRAVIADADPAFLIDQLDGAAAPGELLDALHTLPVIAPRRMVVLAEPEARRGSARALLEALADWVGSEAADTSVLVAVAEHPDRRARWVKAFGDAVVSCDAPRAAREIAAFTRAEAARQRVELERGVAEALAERIGPQLQLLRMEIGKLALLAGPGVPVSRAHVGVGAALAAEEPIWDLTDAIGEGRTADALRVLAHLLSAGEAPPVLLGALVSHFRRLLRVASGGDVPAPPFVRKKLASQAKRYGAARLRTLLGALHETDLALKGAGSLPPELALERVVIALAA